MRPGSHDHVLERVGGADHGLDGLLGLLKKQGYPQADIQMDALEEELLKHSNGIRVDDDLTLIEIRFNPD